MIELTPKPETYAGITLSKIKTGYLAKYKVLATSADTGGVLRW